MLDDALDCFSKALVQAMFKSSPMPCVVYHRLNLITGQCGSSFFFQVEINFLAYINGYAEDGAS